MNNGDFIELLKKYYSDEAASSHSTSDFTVENDDGSISVVEIKKGKKNPIFFLNSSLYRLLGRTFFETKTGVVAFDADTSTMAFLEDGTTIITVMKLQKRRAQWFLCRELFEKAPAPCNDGDLAIELANENYLKLKKRPTDETIHKFFTNASDRINVRAIRYFGTDKIVDHSDIDFFINRLYLPK